MSALENICSMQPTDRQLLTLLDHQIGDDVVYLEDTSPWSLFTFAKQLGYIDEEGFATSKGQALIARIRGTF